MGKSSSDTCLLFSCSLFVFALAFFPLYSNNIFFHVAFGKEILSTGTIGLADPFIIPVHKTDLYVIPYEWGSHVLFGIAYLVTGWVGVISVKALIYSLTAGIALRFSRRDGWYHLLSLLVLLITLLPVHVRFIARATALTELFTCLCLILISG